MVDWFDFLKPEPRDPFQFERQEVSPYTVAEVYAATDAIIAAESWADGDQINLVHCSETDQDVHRNDLYRDGIRVARMSECVHFNRKWKNSSLYDLWCIARAWARTGFALEVARMRIARIRPNRCYSFHNDEDYRFHLPLVTNPSCFFLITKFGRGVDRMPRRPVPFVDMDSQVSVHHMPADGRMFLFDANHVHTAINAGKTDRIHLLFETVSDLNDRPV